MDVGAERQAVGSLFTASLSPNKGGQRRRRRGGVQHRGAPCLQTPAAGWRLTSRTLYDCVCARAPACACEWVKDGERERRDFSLTPAFFSGGEEDQGSLLLNPCDWGGGRTHRHGAARGFVGISQRSCEYSHWLHFYPAGCTGSTPYSDCMHVKLSTNTWNPCRFSLLSALPFKVT